MKLTLAEAKPTIARVLRMTQTDSRVVDYINDAQQALLNHRRTANWWGTYKQLQITVTDGLITWPRCVARVDAIAPCDSPLRMRNQWYEFLEGSFVRPADSDCCSTQGCVCQTPIPFDRGTSPLISDIVGVDKKIRARWTLPTADTGKKVLIKGKDENGDTIYSEYPPGSGTYIEGFYITCVAAPAFVDSPATFQEGTSYISAVDSVLKDDSVGMLRLYELDTTGTERLIASYEPNEKAPEYRRTYLYPFTSVGPQSTCTGCTCTTKIIKAMVKLEFIPAVNDSDFLMISNLRALKLAVMSIWKEEQNLFDESDVYMNGRINPLTKSRQGGAIGELLAEQHTKEGDNIAISFRPFGNDVNTRKAIGTLM